MFGKTMENLRQRRKIDLVSAQESLRKHTAKPSFVGFKIFHADLVAVERKQTSLKLNRPIYTGFSVLDLSKFLMYQFHYEHIKQLYPGEKSKMLFTDTDSLTYLIRTEDIYEDMLKNKQLYDFSGYDKNHKCYSTENKKAIGKFKDELNGCYMEEFVGLKAKMYSLKFKENNKTVESKKAKGVKKYVVKKQITHEDYRQFLVNNNASLMRTACSIRSLGHQLFTIKQNKKSLSSFDDKRYIMNDGISTLAHGHNSIVNNLNYL